MQPIYWQFFLGLLAGKGLSLQDLSAEQRQELEKQAEAQHRVICPYEYEEEDFTSFESNVREQARILDNFGHIIEESNIHTCPAFAHAFVGFSSLWVPEEGGGGTEHTFACYDRHKALRILAVQSSGKRPYEDGYDEAYAEAIEMLDSSRNGFTGYKNQYILVDTEGA